MFVVLFEYRVANGQGPVHAAIDERMKAAVRNTEGFIGEIRLRSLTRDGLLLSVSTWRDERAVMRWRTNAQHHDAQVAGHQSLLSEYRFKVGQVTVDTAPPAGVTIVDQGLDLTGVAQAPVQSLIWGKRPPGFRQTSNPADCAEFLGLNPYAAGRLYWDVYEGLEDVNALLMIQGFDSDASAEAFETTTPGPIPPGGQLQRLRVVRDYSKSDRRDAPQVL